MVAAGIPWTLYYFRGIQAREDRGWPVERRRSLTGCQRIFPGPPRSSSRECRADGESGEAAGRDVSSDRVLDRIRSALAVLLPPSWFCVAYPRGGLQGVARVLGLARRSWRERLGSSSRQGQKVSR